MTILIRQCHERNEGTQSVLARDELRGKGTGDGGDGGLGKTSQRPEPSGNPGRNHRCTEEFDSFCEVLEANTGPP